MSKNFTETELDTLAEEFRSDSTSLPRFARSRGIPYMTMKNHLKKKGDVDVMNGGKACERSVILNEYRESMLSVPEFCERQGISEQYLEAWLEEDSRGRNRGYQSEWKRLIDEFFESDFLNVHDFARAKGFDGSNMKYWLEKIDPEKRWKRKGERFVNGLLEEYHRSGLSQAAFARSKDIDPSTFGFWVRREKQEGKRVSRVTCRFLSEEDRKTLAREFKTSKLSEKKFAASKSINVPTLRNALRITPVG